MVHAFKIFVFIMSYVPKSSLCPTKVVTTFVVLLHKQKISLQYIEGFKLSLAKGVL